MGWIEPRALLWRALLAVLSTLVWMPAAGAGEKWNTTEPDYTKGEVLTGTSINHWALGPIGAFGDIWGQGTGDVTRNTRMILIKSVVKGTPADGVLSVGDVILGVISPAVGGVANTGTNTSDVRFASDARKSLSAAVTAAERREDNGKLVLNIWRQGKTMPVTLSLPVKGSYSATSPWDCEKTTVLIDGAAKSILERGFFRTARTGAKRADGDIATMLDALGLLATGEEKYHPAVREYVRALAEECLKLDIHADAGNGTGIGTWSGAYRNLLLTEYFLVTKDESVLPGITALSMYMALGQSGVGTWSHGMANVRQNGLYGPASAYGAMNQCSVTAAMSLVLAQKCGIKRKEIDDAVTRSLKFYRWYVDKGTVPYGDHAPAEYHDNNGKCSQTAVFFDLAGDKEAADFFTRMTLASYPQRERGHSGQFFSWQWGALGAARGGPAAAQSFIKNTRWYTELECRPDGGYVYQVQLADVDNNKHTNWSTTGSRLLQHCLPRKALHLTGKGGSSFAPIVGDDLKAVVDAGVFSAKGLTAKELLAALGSWSMIVRMQAAQELGQREDDVVKELIAMLDSPNRHARYGACVGLEFAGRGSADAVDALMKNLVSSRDMTFRFFIVNSLKLPRKGEKTNGLGPIVTKAAPELLRLAATYEPDQDPTRKLHNEIASLMFAGGRNGDFSGYFPGGRGSEKVDRPLLIQAMKSFLQNPNGAARSEASQVYDQLSEADLRQLWGDIYHATRYPAPSGVMFSGKVRTNGIKVMANHHIKEGLEVGTQYVFRTEGWGALGRGVDGVPALKPYGLAIKEYFPEVEKFLVRLEKDARPPEKKAYIEAYEYMKKTPPPPLVSIEQYLKEFYASDPGKKKDD